MPISRRKSCHQCRAAKARCSLDDVCSRCSERGLQCDYTGTVVRSSPYQTRSPIAAQAHPANWARPEASSEILLSESEVLGPVSNPDYALVAPQASRDLISNLSIPDQALNTGINDISPDQVVGCEDIDWNGLQWEGDDQLFLPSTASLPIFQPTKAPPAGTSPEPEPCKRTTVIIYGQRLESPLSRRKAATTETFLTTQILLGQLSSYPKMLSRGAKLPPFIYPQCVLNDQLPHDCIAANGMHQCLPEPLANCASLVQMFYHRNSGNARFVWNAIYAEQRRLAKEVKCRSLACSLALKSPPRHRLLIRGRSFMITIKSTSSPRFKPS